MTLLMSVFGMACLLGIATACSCQRSSINIRTVIFAFVLQFAIGAFALYLPVGRTVMYGVSEAVSNVLSYGTAGIEFVFGSVGDYSIGFIFAFNVLPVIVFFSALVAVLYYVGVMGWVIRLIGGGLQKLLGTGRAESLSATANIFVSQTEAPVLIRPYLPTMTRSEIFAVMVGGMASVSGSVLAGYVGLGVELKYLLAASFMAAPGGFLMAKLIIPETEPEKLCIQNDDVKMDEHVNVFDAAASGASSGLMLAFNIGAMLLAFISLIAMLNGLLGWVGGLVGFEQLSIQSLLGFCFRPIAFMLGVPWSESGIAGSLIGQKLVLNEFIAYGDFSSQKEFLSPHTQAVVTFALCGFANFSSIAILLGGLGTMAPSRRTDIAQMGMRAVLAAFLANLMSATIASFFLSLAPGF